MRAPSLLLVMMAGCAGAAPRGAATTPSRAHGSDPLAAWDATPKAPLAWSDFGAATFARAKREHKFVVMDGSAEWCHWCHVMEAVTYHDPAVRSLLDARFIAAKVDVDARPDIEERYNAWGWPATVIFSAEGVELGKYRGFIEPAKFAEILQAVVDSEGKGTGAGADASVGDAAIPDTPMPEEELAWIARSTELGLEDYWDADQGSWGHLQKVPLFMTNEWALERARAGDAVARKRIVFTLDQQLAIIDPVWGGIYQYSTDSDWKHPHFEKLLYFNAGAIANYSDAFALTKDPKYLRAATAIRAYVDRFLSSPEGGFYVTQDADLGAHASATATATAPAPVRFMTGHEYYAKGEAARLALGVPRIDTHEYPRDNGLAIIAYCKYSAAAGDASAVARARKAADRILATHAADGAGRGALTHDVAHADPAGTGEHRDRLVHLSDNAFFALGLLALGEATHDAQRTAQAARIVDVLLRDLQDERGGGFFAHGKDPDAVGVFAARRKPFEDNVAMLRVLARLARALPDQAPKYERAIARTLRAIATPDAIKDRGRMVGDFLLALTETKGLRD